MQADSERFIELATRPLSGNAEVLLAAESELRKSIQPENLATATAALERADRHPHRHRWRLALYVATLIASLPILLHTAKQILVISSSGFLQILPFPTNFKSAEKSILDPEQRLLLYGDSSASSKSGQWKPLWESDPENPAYLVEYAAAYFRDNDDLSPEILAEAKRVDPENGWFLTLQASATADGAVTKQARPSSAVKGRDAPLWVVNDPKRLQDALSQIARLREKPRFASYQNALLRERIALLPPRFDYVSQFPPLAYVASVNSMSIPFRKLVDVLSAGAQECAARGDAAGFLELVKSWKSLVDATSKNSDTLIDHLIAKVIFAGPAANFRDAAKSLGLETEAAYFARVNERYLAEKEAREKRGKSRGEMEELIERRSSILTGLTGPMVGRQVESPPALTDDDFRPARYTDHALFGRMLSGAGWMLLGICAGMAALDRKRQSPLVRGLSARMLDLLRPVDWAWTLLGGVIFPALWFIFVTRFTPLGSREWSLRFFLFIPAGGQFGSMLVSMIVLPVVIANWRLVKRGAAAGFTAPHSWLGWLAAAAALMALPAFGAILISGPLSGMILVLASALLGIAGLWLFSGLVIQIAGRSQQALRQATLGRMSLPAWFFAMLLLAAAIPFHYAEERHWIQQDRMGEITAAAPAMSRYEWEVTQQIRAELLKMIAQSRKID